MSDGKKPMSWLQLLGYACGQENVYEPIRLNEDCQDLKDILGKKLADSFPISPFVRDYERIVSSADFRALQDKTQVYPLSKSDFVRTRLTHSNEVSTIARQLGIMCFQNTAVKNGNTKIAGRAIDKEIGVDMYNNRKKSFSREDITGFMKSQQIKNDIENILACAGLLHDIGNPPFGHMGEDFIREWFNKHLVLEGPDALTYTLTKYEGEGISHNHIYNIAEKLGLKQYGNRLKKSEMILDLENFEGNAQAIRILCKARYHSGVDVSDAVIATIIKYPVTSIKFQATQESINIKTYDEIEKDEELQRLDPEDNDYEDEKSKIIKRYRDKVTEDVTVNPLICHKNGYYHSEKHCVEKIAVELGLTDNERDEAGDLKNIWRHPLAYLLEAADDIAYLTADLEDAVKVNLISLNELYDFLRSKWKEYADKYTTVSNHGRQRVRTSYQPLKDALQAVNKLGEMLDKGSISYNTGIESKRKNKLPQTSKQDLSDVEIIASWGNYLRTWMMYVACNRFSTDYSKDIKRSTKTADSYSDENAGWIMEGNGKGSFNYELLKAPNSFVKITCQMLRDAMKEFVYDKPMLVEPEIAAQEVISFLLDKFVPAAVRHNMEAEMSEVDKQAYKLIPESLKRDYEHEIEELSVNCDQELLDSEKIYHSILMVTDYISSMTDNYAKDLYCKLSGIM